MENRPEGLIRQKKKSNLIVTACNAEPVTMWTDKEHLDTNLY
jgi:hypothetical protein